jgi:hypothetical protein
MGQVISKQEEKMRTSGRLFELKGTAGNLLGGLLLAGLLGGCGLPFIDVDVQVVATAGGCPSGGTRTDIQPGGGCNKETISSPTDANKYGNAKDTGTGLAITDHSHMCTSGVICQSSPGTYYCPFPTLKPCKTLWTQTSGLNGTCQCGCP